MSLTASTTSVVKSSIVTQESFPMRSVKESCERAGGTFESQGRCVCPPGLRSPWDVAVSLSFCSEIDPVGIANNSFIHEEPLFLDLVLSCESPLLTIGVVVISTIALTLSICCCLGIAFISIRKA